MSAILLVLNAGSSSLKFALFEARPEGGDPSLLRRGQIEEIGRKPRFLLEATEGHIGGSAPPVASVERVANHQDAIDLLLDWLGSALPLAAAGHRVVHGGNDHSAPRRLTPAVIDALAELIPLAPHHQPHNLAAVRALAARLPKLPQVACFDTAFHATQPDLATRFGLPRALHDQGLRRYGFHGLSYEYVAGALPALNAGQLPARLVIAHLGNGCSLCALQDGRSIATTMGFSTLEGLLMGTRSGSLDPGVILHLLREQGLDLEALNDLLYNRSGLLGVSGMTADMRALLASDAAAAEEAVALFCYRIVRELGSLAAALGGLDGLVFTGGIGENAAPIRARVCQASGWLGIDLDPEANLAGGPRITTASSAVSAWVVPTNEELVIARHCLALLD